MRAAQWIAVALVVASSAVARAAPWSAHLSPDWQQLPDSDAIVERTHSAMTAHTSGLPGYVDEGFAVYATPSGEQLVLSVVSHTAPSEITSALLAQEAAGAISAVRDGPGKEESFAQRTDGGAVVIDTVRTMNDKRVAMHFAFSATAAQRIEALTAVCIGAADACTTAMQSVALDPAHLVQPPTAARGKDTDTAYEIGRFVGFAGGLALAGLLVWRFVLRRKP